MSSSAQISPPALSVSSPPPRPRRVNPFKRSVVNSGALNSGSSLLARITGTSNAARTDRADVTPTANTSTGSSNNSVDVEEQQSVDADASNSTNSVIVDNTTAALADGVDSALRQPILAPRSSSSSPSLPLHRSSSIATSNSSTRASPLLAVSQVPSNESGSGAKPNNFSRPIVSPIPGAGDSSESMESNASPQQANTDALAITARTPIVASRGNSVSEQGAAPGDDHMVAQAAQLVLEAARKQAQAETRKKGKSAPASPKALGRSFSPVDSRDTGHSETRTAEIERTPKLARASSRSRSKSDAGTGDKRKARKSFFRTLTSRSGRGKESSTASTNPAGNPAPVEDELLSTNAAHAQSGTATPGARRRRFVDTRDIDLLIRELAAEAIAEQVPQPPFARASRSGSSSPLRHKGANASFNDPRRRSFPSILEDAPMHEPHLQSMSPLSTVDKETFDSTDWDAESTNAPVTSLPATPRMLSDDPAMSSVPIEMFTGLGGSPYPSLAQSTALEPIDSFGNSVGHETSSIETSSINQSMTTRRPSQSASSQSSARRPVLTMTMNDPEAELQGLTRPPKSKKSTPFASRAGSRAGSRAVSPRASYSNLKQEAEKMKLSFEANQTLSKLAASQAEAQAAPLELSDSLSSVPVGQNTVTRFSSIFRPSKTKGQPKAGGEDKSATLSPTSTTSPPSTYASPRADLLSLSPESAAVSTHSDNDVSPVAFRLVDLPPVNGVDSSEKTKSTRPSLDASRRPSVVANQESAPSDPPSGGKKGIRKLLRRLSSFGSSHSMEDTHSNSAKENFPDNSTMPAIDYELLKKLNDQREHPQKDDCDTSPGSRELRKDAAQTGLLASSDQGMSHTLAQSTLTPQKRDESEGGCTSRERRPSPHLVRTTSRTPSSEDSVFQSSDNSYSSGRESAGLFKQGSESAMSEELNTPEVSSGYLPNAKQTEEIKAQPFGTNSTGERTPLAREL